MLKHPSYNCARPTDRQRCQNEFSYPLRRVQNVPLCRCTSQAGRVWRRDRRSRSAAGPGRKCLPGRAIDAHLPSLTRPRARISAPSSGMIRGPALAKGMLVRAICHDRIWNGADALHGGGKSRRSWTSGLLPRWFAVSRQCFSIISTAVFSNPNSWRNC